VAQRTGISRRYLEQLIGALRNATLVESVRGRNGGYFLARPPETIKVGQIIEAVNGPIQIVDCITRPELCLIADNCECRLIYQNINAQIIKALNDYSLADLASGLWFEKVGPGLSVAVEGEDAQPEVAVPLGPCNTPFPCP